MVEEEEVSLPLHPLIKDVIKLTSPCNIQLYTIIVPSFRWEILLSAAIYERGFPALTE
jgi:hypothetical protein